MMSRGRMRDRRYTRVGEGGGSEKTAGDNGRLKEGTADGGERWCLGKDNMGEEVRRRGARTREDRACKRRVCLARIGSV
jgi:hypothetical protein